MGGIAFALNRFVLAGALLTEMRGGGACIAGDKQEGMAFEIGYAVSKALQEFVRGGVLLLRGSRFRL